MFEEKRYLTGKGTVFVAKMSEIHIDQQKYDAPNLSHSQWEVKEKQGNGVI